MTLAGQESPSRTPIPDARPGPAQARHSARTVTGDLVPMTEPEPTADRSRGTGVWPLIHTERAALAAALEGLTDDQWAAPSPCTGLTVREVLAHVTAGASLNAVSWLTGARHRHAGRDARARRGHPAPAGHPPRPPGRGRHAGGRVLPGLGPRGRRPSSPTRSSNCSDPTGTSPGTGGRGRPRRETACGSFTGSAMLPRC
ncbi:maleylpyruvate isomerase family mycothiol-dependent enzyme [Streptomyces sp. RK75]|uniref:maleylpyruvate isomerase family mycothiol-dependent enzyme n=1 Tax=Streptomyces sp. RK75 TaxID=2824895 RepID=UPI0034D47AA2